MRPPAGNNRAAVRRVQHRRHRPQNATERKGAALVCRPREAAAGGKGDYVPDSRGSRREGGEEGRRFRCLFIIISIRTIYIVRPPDDGIDAIVVGAEGGGEGGETLWG